MSRSPSMHACKYKAKQSKAKQSKTKQCKAKQNKTKQSKAKQITANQINTHIPAIAAASVAQTVASPMRGVSTIVRRPQREMRLHLRRRSDRDASRAIRGSADGGGYEREREKERERE